MSERLLFRLMKVILSNRTDEDKLFFILVIFSEFVPMAQCLLDKWNTDKEYPVSHMYYNAEKDIVTYTYERMQ